MQLGSSDEVHSLKVSKFFSLQQYMLYLDAPFHMCYGTGLSIVLWGEYLIMVMKDVVHIKIAKWIILIYGLHSKLYVFTLLVFICIFLFK